MFGVFNTLATGFKNYCLKSSLHSSRIFLKQAQDMTKLKNLNSIQDSLRKSVTIPVKNRGFAFRKGPGEYAEHDKFMGVTNPAVRTLAKECKNLTFDEIQILMNSEFNEERFLALVILTERYKKADATLAEEIYQFYLANMANVNNWNLVDTSAYQIVGGHLDNKDRGMLLTLAKSDVLWERRIAMVATFQFIRNNDLTWTFRLATLLLNDKHDLMHKAVGWMLREAGKKDVKQLTSFLDKHAAVMPRTMLRYSLEKLPVEQRKHYMQL